jgi:hypothetical protein
MGKSSLSGACIEKEISYATNEQQRLHALLDWAVEEAVHRCERKYVAPSIVPFIIARLVHHADPSFSESAVRAEFQKLAIKYIEQLDTATRGKFSLSHGWKT